MQFNISENDLYEKPIIKLCNFLKEFNAISHLEMAKLKKLKNTVFN